MMAYSQRLRKANEYIGFVPTMGALHEGHRSLVENSNTVCPHTLVSIFVNPTQFNNRDDFEKYPVTIEKDIFLLEKNHAEAVFLPTFEEVYEISPVTKKYELGYLENILEGKYREGHFQGVCQVVERLLKIVLPTHLFLGQKDYQQCLVIKKLISHLNQKPEVIICPTLREPDGLAMSSRNLRLNVNQRMQAVEISKCLLYIKEHLPVGDVNKLKRKITARLTEKSFRVDYVEICNLETLIPINEWDGKEALIALVAAYIDEVRLIDNILL